MKVVGGVGLAFPLILPWMASVVFPLLEQAVRLYANQSPSPFFDHLFSQDFDTILLARALSSKTININQQSIHSR
jgi:hypothetical protein